MKRIFVLLMLVLAITVVFQPAFAQTGGGYDLSWSTIDGGGGSSSDAVYGVKGTVGQMDAGFATGSGYELSSGFWQTQVTNPTAITLRHINIQSSNPILIFPFLLLLAITVAYYWHRRNDS